MVVKVSLGEAAIGQRLDRALVAALVGQGHEITRSQLARSFAAGRVEIAGKVVKPGLELAHSCEVEVELLPPPALAHAEPEAIPLSIVYEDEVLLVVDKPAGMVVHAGPGHSRGTLVNALLHHLGVGSEELPSLPGNDPALRPGIVHRLDRDTSGLLVVAKTAPALEQLAAQFRTHAIERAYLGVVVGVPAFEERRVETGHGRDPADRRRFAPTPDSRRRAITTVRLMRSYGRASLCRFELETGRTHQIRMHARHLGHPIVGDELYGRRPSDPQLRELARTLGRHALHAAQLGVRHPDGRRLHFEAALPADLDELLRSLEALETRA